MKFQLPRKKGIAGLGLLFVMLAILTACSTAPPGGDDILLAGAISDECLANPLLPECLPDPVVWICQCAGPVEACIPSVGDTVYNPSDSCMAAYCASNPAAVECGPLTTNCASDPSPAACAGVVCGCNGSDYECNDGSSVANDSRCAIPDPVTCQCNGPDYECSDGTRVENDPICAPADPGVTCSCLSTTYTCVDDTGEVTSSEPNSSQCAIGDPEPSCGCVGTTYTCVDGSGLVTSSEVNSSSCTTPDPTPTCGCDGTTFQCINDDGSVSSQEENSDLCEPEIVCLCDENGDMSCEGEVVEADSPLCTGDEDLPDGCTCSEGDAYCGDSLVVLDAPQCDGIPDDDLPPDIACICQENGLLACSDDGGEYQEVGASCDEFIDQCACSGTTLFCPGDITIEDAPLCQNNTIECGCDDGDLDCSDGSSVPDHPLCAEEEGFFEDPFCTCSGTTMYCIVFVGEIEEYLTFAMESSPACFAPTCACEGTTLACTDGSEVINAAGCQPPDPDDPNPPAPQVTCACEGTTLACSDGSRVANASACTPLSPPDPGDGAESTCVCEGTTLVCLDGSVTRNATACGATGDSSTGGFGVSLLPDPDEALDVPGPGGARGLCAFEVDHAGRQFFRLEEICPAAVGQVDLTVLCLESGQWSDAGVSNVGVSLDGVFLSFIAAHVGVCAVFPGSAGGFLAGAAGGDLTMPLIIALVAALAVGGGLVLLARRKPQGG